MRIPCPPVLPRMLVARQVAALVLALPVLGTSAHAQALGGPPRDDREPEAAAARDDDVVVLRAAKILTAAREESDVPVVIDRGVLVIRDGRIEALGTAEEIDLPEGAEVIDVGDRWLMPGLVEMHCHIGAPVRTVPDEINDAVHLTNPELRVSASVVPDHQQLHVALAGGVTTVLFIPGSAVNLGGQGVLLKLGSSRYEDTLLRDPGVIKLAQAGNPEDWATGVGRSLQNWNTRNLFRMGTAYAARWEAFERGEGPEPERIPGLDVYRAIVGGEAQVTAHTQFYQVVLMTISMIRQGFGLDVFINHGSFGGYKAAALAEEAGVPAIVGPRAMAWSFDVPAYESLDTDGSIIGLCAEYQKAGHTAIGFNTDCLGRDIFGVPSQQELSLQAAMAVRYGLDDVDMASVRGLTIVPAETVGLGDRIGSLEPGKDADVVVVSGDPADPRTSVELVLVNGEVVYDAEEERLW